MGDYPTRIPSDALTGEFVPELWSATVLDHVRSNLVSVNVVNTTWSSQLKKGDKLWIPLLAALNANPIDVSDDIWDLSHVNTTIGGTDVYIDIDKWYDCCVQIDDSVKIQTQVGDLASRVASNASFAIEKVIDTDVNTLFATLTDTWAGADGQTFSDDILINLMEGLDEGDVPRRDRSLVCDPSTVADVYKIDKFMTYDYSKDPFKTDGFIGKVNTYNLPLFVSTNLYDTDTGSYGALIHKDAIGMGIQQNMAVEKWRQPDRHSDMISVSALWGSDILRTTFGAYFFTRKKVA